MTKLRIVHVLCIIMGAVFTIASQESSMQMMYIAFACAFLIGALNGPKNWIPSRSMITAILVGIAIGLGCLLLKQLF